MANTRQSAKRSRQAEKRRNFNRTALTRTRSVVKDFVSSLPSKDPQKVGEAYKNAIRALAQAASRGTIPRGRAARKTSRITLLLQKTLPQALAK